MRPMLKPTLAACSLLFTASAAFGQGAAIDGWVPGTALRLDAESPEAPNNGSRFGFAIAMTDTLAVIGAPMNWRSRPHKKRPMIDTW